MLPETVAEELERVPEAAGSRVPTLPSVERRMPDDAAVYRVVSGRPPVDAGERDVIALALARSCTAVIDDRLGRKRALRLGTDLTGTVGVLERLHFAGYGKRSYANDLDALTDAGMFLSTSLKRLALARFRERP